MLRQHHLKIMKDLGYNTYTNSYEDVVGQLLEEVSMAREMLKEKEYQRFIKELDRLKKPTN